ncbi:uncharacterized protein LOC126976189 [Leptidea sinapis]|uniref:uncharacterized protein LOC126976189 n=1 Tax=Leptidea sinapis TaxID=189913 RepID=UPI00213630F9|nr:uncharacterized protein LOC126976189 [Leptidea sinapis]
MSQSHRIIITGLPQDGPKGKIIHYLRQSIFKKPQIMFWVEKVKVRNDNTKQVTVRFHSLQDAEFAVRVLQDHPYKSFDGQIYNLKCFLKESPPEQNKSGSTGLNNSFAKGDHNNLKRGADTPALKQELDMIEVEIELINKKRKLIEAERLLLLEQQKLESLQSNKTIRQSEVKPNPETPKAYVPARKRPLSFYGPCNYIKRDFTPLVLKNIDESMRFQFYKLLRIRIRERFVSMLDGKTIYPVSKLLEEYRRNYPKCTDEELTLDIKKELLENPDMFKRKGDKQSNEDKPDDNLNNEKVEDLTDLPIEKLAEELDEWYEEENVEEAKNVEDGKNVEEAKTVV